MNIIDTFTIVLVIIASYIMGMATGKLFSADRYSYTNGYAHGFEDGFVLGFRRALWVLRRELRDA